MAIIKKRRETKEDVPRWMITYADMVTLLLCFFVLLHAMGKATPKEVQLILSAFNDSLGFFTGGQTFSQNKLEELGLQVEALPSEAKATFLSKARRKARSIFKPELQAKRIQITETEQGITISLIGADYFDYGSARLTPSVKQILTKTSGLIKNLGRFVRVEGHSSLGEEAMLLQTSNRNQIERIYQNTWDLSAARAINAITFMQKQGVKPSWLKAVGYGSYRPLVTANSGTPESNAHNRRIDIVLLNFKSVNRTASDSKYNLPPSLIPGSESIIKDP